MTDYNVRVTVRNGRIIKRMRDLGIRSVAELARQSGVDYQRLAKLVAMREVPALKSGEWRDLVRNVAAVLRCDPEELFNEQQKTSPVARNSAETYMDADAVAALTFGGVDSVDARLTVARLLDGAKLNDREREIVMARAEGATYADIGAEHGLSVERTRQIDHRAQQKMRGAYARGQRGSLFLEHQRL